MWTDNNNWDDIYVAVIIARHCHSSPSSFDECSRWPPTHRPNKPTWAVSPPVSCHHPHPSSPFIITHPRKLIPTLLSRGGWKAELTSSAVKVCSPCKRLYVTVSVVTNTTAHGEIRRQVLAHHSKHATTRLLQPAGGGQVPQTVLIGITGDWLLSPLKQNIKVIICKR